MKRLGFDSGAQEHRFSLKPFEMVVKIFTVGVWRRRLLHDESFMRLLRRSRAMRGT